ncbi:MAG: hypothetical protein WCD18_08065 [Thermosynechococcaceae cyanobacterium]
MRSPPELWQTWQSRLWSRFFLLTVFATRTFTVHERAKFYDSMGLGATKGQFKFEVQHLLKTDVKGKSKDQNSMTEPF